MNAKSKGSRAVRIVVAALIAAFAATAAVSCNSTDDCKTTTCKIPEVPAPNGSLG